MRASPVPLRVPFLRLFVTVIGDDTGQTDDRSGLQRNTLLGKLCGLGCFPFSDSREGPPGRGANRKAGTLLLQWKR